MANRPQHVNRFIRVYERFSDRTSMFDLGVSSLDMLVEFTDGYSRQFEYNPKKGNVLMNKLTTTEHNFALERNFALSKNVRGNEGKAANHCGL
ncbi:hypothetical protein J15TS10_44090 [Paenibacillus woosongensis]|uniref:Uncharacterized protein n=1 Tax=Paenibacillus woosongensis TaxID=307580 RepID=A0ABQ4MXE1_9BACL|nr:hypothetical protein J15TS10_44090 [Paenibacillus woosongensis]